MDAREYLMQYEDADRRVRRLEAEYSREQELIDAVRSTSNFDDVPIKKQNRKAQEERIIRLADKAERLQEAKLQAIEIRQDVMEKINQVEGVESEALYNKYIRLMTWTEVAVLMNYSWPGIQKIKRRGWEQINNILKSE